MWLNCVIVFYKGTKGAEAQLCPGTSRAPSYGYFGPISILPGNLTELTNQKPE